MAINFVKDLDLGMEFLHKNGAFLTTDDGSNTNTMTISWGNVGFEWGKPIFTVLVRNARYTHEIIEKSDEFTVSIPLTHSLDAALRLCGTKSGRDTNKIKEAHLDLIKGLTINTPVIGNCDLFYECRIVYKQNINPDFLSKDIIKNCYSDNDFHTFYYGEIVNCYRK